MFFCCGAGSIANGLLKIEVLHLMFQAFHVPLIFILFHLLCICISFWTLGKCYYQVYLAGVNLLDWVHNHGLDFESLLSIVCVSMMGSLRVLFYWTIFPSELKNTSFLWSVHESLIFVLFISMKEVSEWHPNHVHWLPTETTWFLASHPSMSELEILHAICMCKITFDR